MYNKSATLITKKKIYFNNSYHQQIKNVLESSLN